MFGGVVSDIIWLIVQYIYEVGFVSYWFGYLVVIFYVFFVFIVIIGVVQVLIMCGKKEQQL